MNNTFEIQKLEDLKSFVIQETEKGSIMAAPAVEINRIITEVCEKLIES